MTFQHLLADIALLISHQHGLWSWNLVSLQGSLLIANQNCLCTGNPNISPTCSKGLNPVNLHGSLLLNQQCLPEKMISKCSFRYILRVVRHVWQNQKSKS